MEDREPATDVERDLQTVARRGTRRARRGAERVGTEFRGPGGVVAAVATVVCFYRLGERPLWWWDESFYAVAARNAVERGYWLIPHTAGFDELAPYPFLEKPPLAIWLEAVSIGVFGPTEFAVRAPAAAAAVGATLLAYAVASRLDGEVAGVVAAAVLLTTPALIVGPNGARFGATDTLHTLFGSVVVYLVWLRATDRAAVSPVAIGGVLSALLLTKGFAAGVFVVAAAPLIALRYDRFGRRFVAVVALATTVLVGWWVAAAALIEGGYFVEELFVEQVWRRLTGEMAVIDYATAVPGIKYPYPTVVQVWFWPWWILFLAGAVVTAGRCLRDRMDIPSDRTDAASDRIDGLFPLWWAAAIFVPFALTGTAPWYVVPMYVPAAVLVGRLVADAAGGRRASVAGLGAGTALVVAAGTDRLLYEPAAGGGVAFDLGPDVAPTAALVVLGLVGGCWLWTTDRLGRGRVTVRNGWSLDVRRFARLAVAGGLLALAVGGLVGTPAVYGADTGAARHHVGGNTAEIDAAMRDLGERSDRVVPAGETVYVQPNAEARWFYSSYAFYANRPLRRGPVERLRSDPQVTYVLITSSGLGLVDHRDPEVLATSPRLDLVLVELGPPEG